MMIKLSTKLQLEALEDRNLPSVTGLGKFALEQISFTPHADGSEQWNGIGITNVYNLEPEVSRSGWLTPLQDQVFRMTTVTRTGTPAVASLRNGWIAGYEGGKSFIKNIARDITSPPLAEITNISGGDNFVFSAIANNGIAFGNRLTTQSSEYYPVYWSPGGNPTAFPLPPNTRGKVYGGNATGTLAAGWIQSSASDLHAVVFRPNANIIELDSTGYERSIAQTVSANGDFVAGGVKNPEFINGVDAGRMTAAVWINGTFHELRWSNDAFVRIDRDEILQSTDEGYVVGRSLSGPFIWHPSFNGVDSPFHGAQLLRSWYQQKTGGLVLPAFDQVKDIALSHNGDIYLSLFSTTTSKGYLAYVPASAGNSIAFPHASSIQLQDTAYHDYFYVDVGGFTQIQLNTLAGSDYVELTGVAQPELTTNINMRSGDNRIYLNVPGVHHVTLGDGNDMVISRIADVNSQSKLYLLAGGGDEFVDVYNTFINAQLGNGNDRISARTLPGSVINTGNGDDYVAIGGSSQLQVTTGNGNDTLLMGDMVASSIDTGAGNDTIDATSVSHSQFRTATGNDSITLIGQNNSIWTGEGNDTVTTRFSSANVIRTESGNDTIYSISSSNTIDLGAGNDFYSTTNPDLSANEEASNDTVLGGEGNDTFNLLGGSVKVFGESGRNLFQVSGGHHTISGGADTDLYFTHGGQHIVNLGAGQLNFLYHQPGDQIVKNINDILLRGATPYLRLSRLDYLSILAPILADIQSHGMRRPQLA